MAVYKMTPTKANLMKAKNFLEFSKKGYDLLDKKRTVLIREMMALIDEANKVQEEISEGFKEAYDRLKYTNITMGSETVEEIAMSLEKEEEFEILFKSVMGVEIPYIKYEERPFFTEYGFFRTNPTFDMAVLNFIKIRYLVYRLAEIENSVYKLAVEIKKTQKRANALEKIQIPKYTREIKFIQEVLEEKEREDFFRMKKVKEKKY
ncbi:V-type ATP synthase subunit D [Sporanaerobacter acetigenes]|uniref:V-type ATP synthase subunit D n=1 Tax=Sporanaerobacter acetigenes DSM 13106 TaxID=1123281 RepID=A0A1M5VU84_9FIRM|nr:V-type ATP synthase subunit D [Sporanaerobacter acetigenes]SHH78835.1 V/A-type H+-transporting ATPase subunit D [Sporanaerobacter acetigenes DSM 13106]